MVRAVIALSGVLIAVAVAGQFGLVGGSRQLKAKFASELQPSDPEYLRVMCGPQSLSIALGRLGVAVRPEQIAEQCRVTEYGVALSDLERAADNISSIDSVAKQLRWHDLQAIDGVVLLFVNSDHYVAADPRELPPTPGPAEAIRVYDQDVPAKWVEREELEGMWNGETLVITRHTDEATQDSPRIIWNECYRDGGVQGSGEIAKFQFAFANSGNQDLIIENVHTSCGCISHRLSSERVAAGNSANVEVDVNLEGRDGYIEQYMIVKSNDPANPLSYLRMACGVPRKRTLSCQAIRLADLTQGENLRHEFVVADPAFSGIRIQNASFQFHDNSRNNTSLSCTISWEAAGGQAQAVSDRIGFPTSSRDYVLRLSFDADGDCPVGVFAGQVVVDVESKDDVSQHKVDVQGMVVPDVQAIPQMALITLGADPNSAGTASIQLRSRTQRPVSVTQASTDHEDRLTVIAGERPEDDDTYFVISARIPTLEAGAAPFRGNALFQLERGTTISVPVTVFRPPFNEAITTESTGGRLTE